MCSCDWLSNCIFTVVNHSWHLLCPILQVVVIGFQIVFLRWWITVSNSIDIDVSCCDWLSNCIFTVVNHSTLYLQQEVLLVVIGFQIVFLRWWITVGPVTIHAEPLLWLAFKLYFYGGESQSQVNASKTPSQLWLAFKLYFYGGESQSRIAEDEFLGRCDWLSNCIFTVVNHSSAVFVEPVRVVVIGFQIVFLRWWITVLCSSKWTLPLLWLAFKLYFYGGESQS